MKEKTESEVYLLLFPEKRNAEAIYELPDYEYIQRELGRPGVTNSLLYDEYVRACRLKGTFSVGKTKFYDDYRMFCAQTKVTNRVIHKPGVRIVSNRLSVENR